MFQAQFRKLHKLFSINFIAALGFLLFTSIITTQAQTNTFANFQQRFPSQQNFVFTNNITNATFNTVSGGNPVRFFYDELLIAGLPIELQNEQEATLTLTSTTTTPSSLTGTNNLTQPINATLTIAIIRNTAATVGANTRRNLLTVTVTQSTSTADLVGAGGSVTYSASDSATAPRGQVVTYTSDFLDFTQTTARNIALNFTSVTPNLSQGAGNFLSNFVTSGGGSFASSPVPFVTITPPTSASVNIGGRVLNTLGRGIRGAHVSLTDGSGTTRTAITNSFGYYNFNEVAAGQTVVVAVASKRYLFNTQVVSVGEELTGLNFTAIDQLQKSSY